MFTKAKISKLLMAFAAVLAAVLVSTLMPGAAFAGDVGSEGLPAAAPADPSDAAGDGDEGASLVPPAGPDDVDSYGTGLAQMPANPEGEDGDGGQEPIVAFEGPDTEGGGILPFEASGLNVEYRTQAQIKAYAAGSGASMNNPTDYDQSPIIAGPGYYPGTLTSKSLNDALAMLNQIRYIAGLDADVALDAAYSEKAQAASMLNDINKTLSHDPLKPPDMDQALFDLGYSGAQTTNIAMSSPYRNLSGTIVLQWMQDSSSASNMATVGHRRWIINPRMQKTGFGRSGNYSSMYAHDTSRPSSPYSAVAWPAQNMPVEYFSNAYPWSVSIGQRPVSISGSGVTLTRQSDGKTWNIPAVSTSPPVDNEDYLAVNNDGYGQMGCIIFRPSRATLTSINKGDVFDVDIEYSLNGVPSQISYTVSFFSIDECTASFDANGGAVSPPEKAVAGGQAYGTLPTPTRPGYGFDGWFTAASGGTLVTSSTIVSLAVDHTLYAHWTAKTLTATFDAQGGSVSPTSKPVTVGQAYGTLPTPARPGYVFDGWFTAAAPGGTAVTEATAVPETDSGIALYAHWTAKKLTLTFDPKGGDVTPGSKEVTVGQAYGILPTPTKADYSFAGWHDAETDGKAVTEASLVPESDEGITLFAYWELKPQEPLDITADFADLRFAAAVRKAAGLDSAGPIHDCDVLSILALDASNMEIGRLDGLQWLANLEWLDCSGNKLAGLPGLPPKLECLVCSGNMLTGLDITGMDKLAMVDCRSNFMESEGDVSGYGAIGLVLGETLLFHPQNAGAMPPTTKISVTPSHGVLAGTGETDFVAFEAFLDGMKPDYGKVAWSYGGSTLEGGLEGDIVISAATGKSVTVKASGPIDKAQTVQVRAVYDGKYTATATVELLPAAANVEPGQYKTAVRVLEPKVEVNKAKLVGGLVPLFVSQQPQGNFGLTDDWIKPMEAAGEQAAAGSLVFDAVGMYSWASATDAKNRRLDRAKDLLIPPAPTKTVPYPVAPFAAKMCPTDGRYIEVNADATAKTQKYARIRLHIAKPGVDPVEDDDPESWIWVETASANNVFQLAVTDKYPKVAFKPDGELNTMFPGRAVGLAAICATGENAKVAFVSPQKAADAKLAAWDSGAKALRPLKPGTAKLYVAVDIEGYKDMESYLSASKWPKFNIGVAGALPKLKLNATSATMLDHASAKALYPDCWTGAEDPSPRLDPAVRLQLLTANKKYPFERDYAVLGVECVGEGGPAVKNRTDVAANYAGGGWIEIWPTATTRDKNGNIVLKVTIEDKLSLAEKEVFVTLAVKTVPSTAVTLKGSPASATVNEAQISAEGVADPDKAFIARTRITPSVQNCVAGGWAIQTVGTGSKARAYAPAEGEALPNDGNKVFDAIGIDASDNLAMLYIKDVDALKALVGVKNKKPAAAKYVLNIGSPGIKTASGAIRTFAFTLTVAPEASAMGFTVAASKQKIDIANPASFTTLTVKPANMASEIDKVTLWADKGKTMPANFTVIEGSVDGNTFKIQAIPNKAVPNVNNPVWAEVKFKNGVEKLANKALNIKPTQTVTKNYKRTVTLYKTTPFAGGAVDLGLTKPEGVETGVVALNAASVKALKFTDATGFELSQSGKDTWGVYFADGRLPTLPLKKGNPVALKSSYKVKAEVWAEGTYETDEHGAFVRALGTTSAKGKFTARSKPTYVTITVYIK